MLNKYAKGFFTQLLTPLARLLMRLGVGPDAVSIVGTFGVVVGVLVLYPLGQLFWGTVVATVFVFADMIDGLIARLGGRHSLWGAFLDSTLDRVADAAIFVALTMWFFTGGGSTPIAVLALVSMVTGFLVSYAAARAQSLGIDANVGVAERSERLIIVLVATGLVGLGLSPWLLAISLVALIALSLATLAQRAALVYRASQASAE